MACCACLLEIVVFAQCVLDGRPCLFASLAKVVVPYAEARRLVSGWCPYPRPPCCCRSSAGASLLDVTQWRGCHACARCCVAGQVVGASSQRGSSERRHRVALRDPEDDLRAFDRAPAKLHGVGDGGALAVGPGDGGIAPVPVVVLLGHFDHGKTTLLDSLGRRRRLTVEVGDITQAIRTRTIELGSWLSTGPQPGPQPEAELEAEPEAPAEALREESAAPAAMVAASRTAGASGVPGVSGAATFAGAAGFGRCVVTAVDTPGQEIFHRLRLSGALGADVVVLVVDAVEGVGRQVGPHESYEGDGVLLFESYEGDGVPLGSQPPFSHS